MATVVVAKCVSLTGDRVIVLGPFAEGDHWDSLTVFYGDQAGCYVRFGVAAQRSSAEADFDTGCTSLVAVIDSTVPGIPMISNGIAGLPYGYGVFPINHVFAKEQPFLAVWIRPVAQPSPAGINVNVRPGEGRKRKPPKQGTHIPTEASFTRGLDVETTPDQRRSYLG